MAQHKWHKEIKNYYATIALMGTGEPYQTKTLSILKAERKRIANNILNAPIPKELNYEKT